MRKMASPQILHDTTGFKGYNITNKNKRRK